MKEGANMPKIVSEADSKDKWNFYFPKLLKLEMHHKLLRLGLQGKQSALLRTLVRMFVNDEIDETKVLDMINEEVYITASGKQSVL